MKVKQISNLFRLMELFARSGEALSVREIVAAFGWPRSSAFNIVTTLVQEGYLYQPVARGGYYPTAKWMELARELSDSQPLPPSVHALLAGLCAETGETLFLAAPEGTSVVFLDVVESSADIRFIASIGQRLPIHVTAAGRAILAQYGEEERAKLYQRIHFQAFEKDTLTSPGLVEEAILAGQERGWHLNLGIYAPGVAGVAVPLPLGSQRYAIALGGPVSRVEGREAEIGELLRSRVGRYLKDLPV